MTRMCVGCGGEIPLERRSDSRFCSTACRKRHRAAYFAKDGRDWPPGTYLLFLHAPAAGLVQVSFTHALRTRVRTAQASSPHALVMLGAVPADAERAERFREAHKDARVRGSWYRPTRALMAYVERHGRHVGPLMRYASFDPSDALDEAA